MIVVLYVEDDDDFYELFVSTAMKFLPDMILTRAVCAEEARTKLSESSYHAVILDLAIPRKHGDSAHVEMGAELAREIAVRYSSTPILLLTGQVDERETDDLQEEVVRRISFSGGEERRLLIVKRKDKADRIINLLAQMKTDLEASSKVILSRLDNRGLGSDCSEEDRHLLKAFCRLRGGVRGRVRRLSGGLSGGSVYRLDVLAGDNSVTQRCVAKLHDADQIEKEQSNYDRLVTRLPYGYPPAVPGDVIAGGARRGLFYNLADGFESCLFDFMDAPAELLTLLRDVLRIWHDARITRTASVREMVVEVAGERGLLSLETAAIPGVQEILDTNVDFSQSIQHGDLHGMNVLCRTDGSDLRLIDFGDCRATSSVLDLVTLELSPLFHPSTAQDERRSSWRNAASVWFDDSSLDNSCRCPWFGLVRAWARESALSHLELATVVLAYCARQLKYVDTDRELAIALIEASVAEFRDN